MNTITYKPIGRMICDTKEKYSAPRQPIFSHSYGQIEIFKDSNMIQGLKDLDGFEMIWVVFHFNQNQHWKPLVSPPINSDNSKKGVFSTRSPYRPNGIGLSAVELIRVEKNTLFIGKHDLLDQTPILDIKPYIPRSDSFPDVRFGWVEDAYSKSHSIKYSSLAEDQTKFLEKYKIYLKPTIHTQLEFNPLDIKRKRVEIYDKHNLLKIGTWRVKFSTQQSEIEIIEIFSGYFSDELINGDDPYNDKSIHLQFINNYSK